MPDWLRHILPAFLERLAERISDPAAFFWVLGLSVTMFLATIVGVPIFLARLPEDYLRRSERRVLLRQHTLPRTSPKRILLAVLRNTIGFSLVLLGLLMLVLPGQGLLTMFVGLILADFPGKYRVERWLISKPSVLNAINALRRRMKRPPFKLHPPPMHDGHGVDR